MTDRKQFFNYVEHVIGRSLYLHEKLLIDFYVSLPKNARIVMGRKGHMIAVTDVKEVKNDERTNN